MGSIQKNRISYFDNLRFFLILTVVVGHFADLMTSRSNISKSLFLWIYSFHMPLFIFISGIFHKNERILPKMLRLIMIGYLLKIFHFLTLRALKVDAALSYYGMDGFWWYVFVLAGYIGISYLLRKIDKRSIFVFSIILGLFSGYDPTLGDTFYASRFIVFYPFFVLGEMLSLRTHEPIKNRAPNWARLFGLLFLSLWAVLCVFKLNNVYMLRPLFTGRNPFGDRFGTWGFLYRGLCYVISLVTGFGVMCLVPEMKLPVITHLGKRTMQIYFWHDIIIQILMRLPFYSNIYESSFGKFTWLLLGVICTFVTGLKLFGFPTDQIIRASRYAQDQNTDK